jgi:hypothetical protein
MPFRRAAPTAAPGWSSPRRRPAGKYRGRPEDKKRNAAIAGLLAEGKSWAYILNAIGYTRATLAK